MFAYCKNNPVNMADSSGSYPIESGSDPAKRPAATLAKDRHRKYGDGDVPDTGEPGSYAKSPDGTKERVYGPSGRQSRDRHHTNHGNAKKHPYVPHDHDWGYNEAGEWVPGPGYPSPPGKLTPKESFSIPNTDQQTVGEIVGFGVAVFVVYEIVKWSVAAFLAPTTLGASLAGAALTP